MFRIVLAAFRRYFYESCATATARLGVSDAQQGNISAGTYPHGHAADPLALARYQWSPTHRRGLQGQSVAV
jgi:hypothetical protein